MTRTPKELKAQLARDIAAAKARGDHHQAELLTFDWHRAHDADLSVSGLSARLRRRTRDRAAALARVPLSERVSLP